MTIKKRYCQYCGSEINYKWFCKNCNSWCVPRSWIWLFWFVLGLYTTFGAFWVVLNFNECWIPNVGEQRTQSAFGQQLNIGTSVQPVFKSGNAETRSQQEIVEILAPKLRSAIETNPVQWHFEHDGKRLRILGVVRAIRGTTKEAKIELYMDDYYFIYATFAEREDIQKIAQLKAGSIVIIEGLCHPNADAYSNFPLQDATIAELPPQPNTLPELELTTEELAEEMAEAPEKWILMNWGRKLVITGAIQESVGSYVGYGTILKIGEGDFNFFAYGENMSNDFEMVRVPAGAMIKISGHCFYKGKNISQLSLKDWEIELL